MKETVNANIGSIAFTIDRDAYQALEHYFREIRRRLPDDDTETMGDIESRVAEILVEKVPSPMHVVTLEIVRATMARLGAPSDFGEPHDTAGVAGTGSDGMVVADESGTSFYTDARYLEAAADLGGNKFTVFTKVTFCRIYSILTKHGLNNFTLVICNKSRWFNL